MATGGKDRDARAARERARLYQARREYHEGQARRRRRDNLIAGVAGGLLVLAVGAAQTAYFVAGPGAQDPTPAPSSTSSPAEPTPTATPSGSVTPTTDPTGTPSPTP